MRPAIPWSSETTPAARTCPSPGGPARSRAAARPGAPGRDHRVDRLAVSEPPEERLVDRHRRVGGEHPASNRKSRLHALRDAEEAAYHVGASFLLAGLALAGPDLRDHALDLRDREE